MAAALVYWNEGDHPVAKEMTLRQATGRALAQAREDEGLTQDQAAARLGVSRRTIVKYESGEGNKFDFIYEYAEALGLTEVKLMVLAKMKRRINNLDPNEVEDRIIAEMLKGE
jgi:transcriptional regulator with XRE-family HTH domain